MVLEMEWLLFLFHKIVQVLTKMNFIVEGGVSMVSRAMDKTRLLFEQRKALHGNGRPKFELT